MTLWSAAGGGRHPDGVEDGSLRMTSRLVPPRLMLLTDRAQLSLGRGLLTTVRECVDAGLTWVVVREHDLAPAARAAVVERLAEIEGLTVISSRVVDPSAAGVHLAACQGVPGGAACNALLPRLTTRCNGALDGITARYMGGAVPWGRSCHTVEEVRAAADEGAAWATLSPYAATASKPGYGPALGPRPFEGPHDLPVFALGGIDAGNAAEARAAGAYGVAVMGAVMRAHDPASVIHDLLGAVGGA